MAKSFYLSLMFKGVLIAALLAIILSIGFGILLSFTEIPESDVGNIIIYSISVFIASFMIGFQVGKKGIYYGISIGAGFIILLLIVSSILAPNNPSWILVSEKSIIAIAAGGVGGILGVVFHRP